MKKHLLGIFAFVIAISMSAFTAPEKASKTAPQWFILNNISTPGDANAYSATETQPCDGQSQVVCGVYATEDPENEGHPILDETALPVKFE